MVFDRTRAAFAALDQHESGGEAERERLRRLIGVAFAAETATMDPADLCADACRHMDGLEWVRDFVRRC